MEIAIFMPVMPPSKQLIVKLARNGCSLALRSPYKAPRVMDEASMMDSTKRPWVMAPGSKIADSSEAAFALILLLSEDDDDADAEDEEDEDLGLYAMRSESAVPDLERCVWQKLRTRSAEWFRQLRRQFMLSVASGRWGTPAS